jgi:hypothetical protein
MGARRPSSAKAREIVVAFHLPPPESFRSIRSSHLTGGLLLIILTRSYYSPMLSWKRPSSEVSVGH